MLEYAHTERTAIQHCMEDLGYVYISNYQREGRQDNQYLAQLPKEARVKNYHTMNGKVEPNGTRFLGLTKIVVKENGQLVTYNLNDPNKSS